MTKTSLLRRIARAIGASLTELGINALTWIGAGVGGYIGFGAAPGSWATGWKAALAGIGALAFAVGFEDLLDDVVAPLRRLTDTRPAGSRYSTAPELADAPATAHEGLTRLREAACADSASRAASDSYRIDRGQVLLTEAGRWQGYPDGTASFQLAPGAYLRYWRDSKSDGTTPGVVFTFVTGEADKPVHVTDVQQLQGLLADYAGRTLAGENVATDTGLQAA
ncbi:hypothetical protein [Actinacidiphila yeochonensis]|uniref:hypothetical protein n=1 Tax=Actinacidiphila yeochonensis TaxID=89050 RepID=UPI000567152E|nr:hypothetical protein [Actinacidiphila yeochonensis]